MASIDTPRRPLSREPTLHFIIIGAVVFAAVSAFGAREEADELDPQVIHIDDAFMDALVRQHMSRSGETPTHEELHAAMAEYVADEVMVREAIALGLDQGDPIIRRRLVNKVRFLTEQMIEVEDPTDEELQAYIEASPERFSRQAVFTFDHLFFSNDRREDPHGDAMAAFQHLSQGESLPEELEGDPFVHGLTQRARNERQIRGAFGPVFTDALPTLPLLSWSGPVASTHGVHVVRVVERSASGLPPLETVRAQAVAVWTAERRAHLMADRMNEMRESYNIVIDVPGFELDDPALFPTPGRTGDGR